MKKYLINTSILLKTEKITCVAFLFAPNSIPNVFCSVFILGENKNITKESGKVKFGKSKIIANPYNCQFQYSYRFSAFSFSHCFVFQSHVKKLFALGERSA